MKEILIFFLLIFYPKFALSENSDYDYSDMKAKSVNTNLTSKDIISTMDSDENLVYINVSGIVFEDATISKYADFKGYTEFVDYGIYAIILVQGGGELTMIRGIVSTTGPNYDAVIATNGGSISFSGTSIKTSENFSPALHTTYGGKITANNVTISTGGELSPPLYANKRKGMINCSECNLFAKGEQTPLIYSTGESTIDVKNSTGNSSFGEVVILEGKSSAIIRSSYFKCSVLGIHNEYYQYGVYILDSSKEITGAGNFICEDSTLEILSTSLYYKSAPFFFITNTDAEIQITNCNFIYGSGNFLITAGSDYSSDKRSVSLILKNQKITGNIEPGLNFFLTIQLFNSTIEGKINSNKTASKLELILDVNSRIILTGNSCYTSFSNAITDNSNIITGSYSLTDCSETPLPSSNSNSSESSLPNIPSDNYEGTGQSEIPPEKPANNTHSSEIISSSIINDDNNTNTNSSSSDVDNENSVILLGFSHFKKNDNEKNFSFYIYFIRLLNSIISKILTFPLIVTHNSALRFLQNTEEIEASCTLEGTGTEAKLQFNCKAQTTETSNIGQIKIIPNFNFGGQKVNLDSISPLANNYMDNIQDIGEQFNYLLNSNLYILDNSFYNKHDNGFYISGIMKDPQPNFRTNNLVLNITLNSSGTISETVANCVIDKVNNKNYTLNCQQNEDINSENLKAALSKVDDDILFVNFVQQNQEEDGETQSPSKYVRKSSSGLSGGAIAAIIIVPIVALAIIAGVIVYFVKRKSQPKTQNSESEANIANI